MNKNSDLVYRLPRLMKTPLPNGEIYVMVKSLIEEHNLNTLHYRGRVTGRMKEFNLKSFDYVYLCGNSDMINDILIIFKIIIFLQIKFVVKFIFNIKLLSLCHLRFHSRNNNPIFKLGRIFGKNVSKEINQKTTNMKKSKILIAAILMIGISLTSCLKEGPVGPQGPQGPAGDGGETSVTGLYYTVEESEWTEEGTYGVPSYGFYSNLYIDEIDEDILDNGAVLIYLYQDGSLYSLPGTYINLTEDGVGYTSTYWTILQTGGIVVKTQDDDGYTINPGTQEFKVVIIEGMKSLPASVNIKNYYEVKEYLNIQDK